MSPAASARTAYGAAEEAELWRGLRTEVDAFARSGLFERYRPLALKIARRHFLDRSRGDIELGDLRQMAFAGLLEAIEAFKPEARTRFGAFAAKRIAGAIVDGIAKLSELREQASFRSRVNRERLRSLAANKAPTRTAEAMELLAEVAAGLAISFMLDGSGLNVEEGNQTYRVTPYETFAWNEALQRLTRELAELPAAERAVVSHHYTHGLGFDQIAAVMGLSRGRVSQLHRSALQFLRERLGPVKTFNLEG